MIGHELCALVEKKVFLNENYSTHHWLHRPSWFPQMADFLLTETDWDVCGMMRWQEPINNIYHLTERINRKDRITLKYADLNDFASLQRLISDVRPSFIFHLAAQSFQKLLLIAH